MALMRASSAALSARKGELSRLGGNGGLIMALLSEHMAPLSSADEDVPFAVDFVTCGPGVTGSYRSV